MKRALLIGAALATAVVAAIPLWLVLDDGGVRRLGSIDPTTVQGRAGRLTLGTGSPIAIDSFTLGVKRPVGSTQPETDFISVTLDLDASMPSLVGRAAQGKGDPGKIELVKPISGTDTVYMTFDLTNVTVESFQDSYQTTNGRAAGTAGIVLRYDAMNMTCIPVVCFEPPQQSTNFTEMLVPDLGGRAVLIDSGTFAVPKGLKSGTPFPVTVTMYPTYFLAGLLTRARDGRPFEKTIQVDLLRTPSQSDTLQKFATYKLAAAAVTSLGISASQGLPIVSVQLSSRRVGVYAYTYTSGGAADKTSSFCWDSDKSASGCTGF